jgi:uncharacterized protein (TIGR02594 family)
MIVTPTELEQKAAELSSCAVNQVKTSMSDILKEFGIASGTIDLVNQTIDSVSVEQDPIVSVLGQKVVAIPEQIKPVAQNEVNKEFAASQPQKPTSSVNGYQADNVIEPINVFRVSKPKDIPNNNNSFEEDHPNTFGGKDRAGNFVKHNLITGLYQQGLRNGYVFRSDQNGNTTIYIPGNHKVNIEETYNINSGAMDLIMNGEGYFESNKKITIKAPEIELIGHLTVTGPQNNTQTIDAIGNITSESVVKGSVDVVFANTSSVSHVHMQKDGNDAGGGVETEPPKSVYVKKKLSAPPKVDTPETYYTPNVLPKLSSTDVPEKYPTNKEQVETASPVAEGVSGASQSNPFQIAQGLMDLGKRAWGETGNNPNITSLWDEIGYSGETFADHTAWCAVFVGACLKRSGNKYIKTASSQGYSNYGVEVPVSEAKVGDIVVFYRKGSSSGYGHVGFYAGAQTADKIAVLGGNQSDSLNIRYFSKSKPAQGWGIKTVRRAVSANDGTTIPPEYAYILPSNVYTGDKVV